MPLHMVNRHYYSNKKSTKLMTCQNKFMTDKMNSNYTCVICFILLTSKQWHKLIANIDHYDRTKTNYLKNGEVSTENVSGTQNSHK